MILDPSESLHHPQGVIETGGLLPRRFRRLSIWLGWLAGIATFLLSMLRMGASWDTNTMGIGTVFGACALGVCVGLLSWAIARGVGMVALGYRQGTWFEKGYILVAALAGLGCVTRFAYRVGWTGTVFGLVAGVLVSFTIIAVASALEWVVLGFRCGRGYQRLALLLAFLSAIVVLGGIYDVRTAVRIGAITARVWWACDLRRKMEWRLLASRMGWFVGVTVWHTVSELLRHGRDRASLDHGVLWGVFLGLGTGLAARLITIFIGSVTRRRTHG